MEKKTNLIALEEAHLNIIIDSFYQTQLKDIKNPLVADKKKLIFKICDNFKVSENQAKKYLNILESRNLIDISEDSIYYNQSKFKERTDKEIDIDKFFKDIK
jgi:hypothetical protein